MEKNKQKNNLIQKKERKDCFNSAIMEDASFDGYYDMPIIGEEKIIVPEKLISYEIIRNHNFENMEFVHFYMDDYKFDGQFGVWNTINNNPNDSRGFSLKRFAGASGVIAPDYSLYMDMPRAMQIWNVYRSRAVAYYLSKKGLYVIPNVRWADEESYDFAFAGVRKNGIVAVGTHGCYKKKKDRYLFHKGFLEMIKRLNPKFIIIYGAISSELIAIMLLNNIKWKQFCSDTHNYFEEK